MLPNNPRGGGGDPPSRKPGAVAATVSKHGQTQMAPEPRRESRRSTDMSRRVAAGTRRSSPSPRGGRQQSPARTQPPSSNPQRRLSPGPRAGSPSRNRPSPERRSMRYRSRSPSGGRREQGRLSPRNRSRSPQSRYEVSVSNASIGQNRTISASRDAPTSGRGGNYSQREQFQGPELSTTMNLAELPKMRVDVERPIPAQVALIPTAPTVRETVDPSSVHLIRRPGRTPSTDEDDFMEREPGCNGGSVVFVDPTPSELPEHYHCNKSEGSIPMFSRAEIREGIEKRRFEEADERLAREVTTIGTRPAEQRVVAIIRESPFYPIFPGATTRPRERGYEDDERHRRGDSRDRDRYHHSPSRHYESRRHDDLRHDLDLRRRDGDRHRSRSRERDRDREREREREYYRRRHSREREYERERERERERRRREERDYRERHSPRGDRYRRSSPHDRGYPPRSSDHRNSGGYPPPASNSRAPPRDDVPPPQPFMLDPEYVPRGQGYFEHDNRDTFVPFLRGRGGFGPRPPMRGMNPRGGFIPRGGRGGFRPDFPPFNRGGPPRFIRPGARSKPVSPKWQHDLYDPAVSDQKPSSTTAES